MNDAELLDQWTNSGSRDALAELVRRHVGWVHAVARRRLGDVQFAEDVTQATFLVLMQKPPRLRDPAMFSGWLLRVASHLCNRVIRTESRRRRREKAFAMEHDQTTDPMSQLQWAEISPHLDEAVLSLNDDDRKALMLRFYEQKSHIEVAEMLGISHDAARQRVGRAVAKLREYLGRRGVVAPAAAVLAGGLELHTAPPASAALVQSAVGAVSGAATASQATIFAKGVILMMMIQKVKIAALACVTVLVLAGGTAAVVMMNETEQQATKAPVSPPAPVEPVAQDDAWLARFIQAYRLEEGQILKLVPPPFIPERGMYFRSVDPRAQYPEGPDVLTFIWDNANPPGRRSNGFGMASGQPLDTAAWLILKVDTYLLEVPEALKSFKLKGDWVIRQGASQQEILDALCRMMKDAGGPSVRFSQQDRTIPFLITTGSWRNQPLPEGAAEIPVNVFVDQPDPFDQPQKLPNGGSARTFTDHLARLLGLRVEHRIARPNLGASYRIHSSVERIPRDPGPERDEQIQKVLNVVSQQTDLRFTVEERKVKVWVAEEVPAK